MFVVSKKPYNNRSGDMSRITFRSRRSQANAQGFELERDTTNTGYRYCFWFNSPTGSKEWFLANLAGEFEEAMREAIAMKLAGT